MPNHVLVPFDGSPLSEHALEYACSEYPSSTITALYVVDQRTDDTAAKGWGDHPGEWDEWLDDRRAHAEELFAGAREIADERGASIQTGVAVGRVASAIIETAEEYGADLLVVGAHGRPSLEKRLIGEVAGTLVRRSPIPITTIRQPHEE